MPENPNSLQQMYLIRAELNQFFTSNISEEQQSARLTLKALLETTSSPENNIIVYPQKHVKQRHRYHRNQYYLNPKMIHIG